MTPPGAFVCWTDLVDSPATRTTLRSPVPPSRFSMRQESLPSLQWYAKRLGTRPLSTLLLLSHRAEAGERGPGVPFQPDHDLRLAVGVVAEGDLGRRIPCRLQFGGRSGRRLLRDLRPLPSRVASLIGLPGLIGAGPGEEQHKRGATSPPARSHELLRSQRNPRASILSDETFVFSRSGQFQGAGSRPRQDGIEHLRG